MKISLLIYNRLQDLKVFNCCRFYSDVMSFLLFVLDMNSVSFVHFYVNPKLSPDESLGSNVSIMEYALNMLCISESQCCISFSTYQNSCLCITYIKTNNNISCWHLGWINGHGDKEDDIKYKFISQDYNTLIKHGFNKTKLIDDDITFVLQERVVSRNLTYFEEVGQLIFDKIENIVNMCIYSNKNTSVYTINGQLIIDITSIIARLLISNLILATLYKVQMDSLTMEANKIANDTLTLSNEYTKQQRELVLDTNFSRNSSDTNNIFLDYIVMISKGNLYAFLTLSIMINIKIIDNSSNSNDDISFGYQLCQEFLCKDCFVSMIEDKILKGIKESKFFEINIFNTFPTYNIKDKGMKHDKEFLENVSVAIIFNTDGDEHTSKTVWKLTCITIIITRNEIAQLGVIKYNSSGANKTQFGIKESTLHIIILII